MLRRVLASAALILAIAGCAPVTAQNGFQALDVKPADIKVGETRSAVLGKLGSPSQVGTFDKDTWFYVSATTEKYAYYKPRTTRREVTAIKFDKDEKVAEVKSLTLKDGYQVAYDRRETPTRGREMSIFEQLLGNVGRGGIIPQDNDPGNPRGNR